MEHQRHLKLGEPPVEQTGWRYVADLRLRRCDKAQLGLVHTRRRSEALAGRLSIERPVVLGAVLLEARTAEQKTLHISSKTSLMQWYRRSYRRRMSEDGAFL